MTENEAWHTAFIASIRRLQQANIHRQRAYLRANGSDPANLVHGRKCSADEVEFDNMLSGRELDRVYKRLTNLG